MGNTPESYAIGQASDAVHLLRNSIDRLVEVQEKASASTDRLGKAANFIGWVAVFATCVQIGLTFFAPR